jgi:hypothetical protein
MRQSGIKFAVNARMKMRMRIKRRSAHPGKGVGIRFQSLGHSVPARRDSSF